MPASTAPSVEETTIANDLGYLTEEQVLKIGKLKPSTTQAWAKRRSGPEYVIFGNSRLYPRRPFLEFLEKRIRKTGLAIPAKELL
ncbi:MAG: hypothetical protein H0V16_00045 [Burkholderiaceae bacterium]|nr:hypothetical protein [Burkholderiaceae bacterium]